MGLEKELDECLKGTHRGGLRGGRYGVIVIVYTHRQSKGTENRPAEAEQDQHRLREYDQKGDRAGPRRPTGVLFDDHIIRERDGVEKSERKRSCRLQG